MLYIGDHSDLSSYSPLFVCSTQDTPLHCNEAFRIKLMIISQDTKFCKLYAKSSDNSAGFLPFVMR